MNGDETFKKNVRKIWSSRNITARNEQRTKKKKTGFKKKKRKRKRKRKRRIEIDV